MNILCLSVVPDSASTLLLAEAARRRGHEFSRQHPLALGVILANGRISLLGDVAPDIVLTRMGGGTPGPAFDALFAVERAGFPIVNHPAALSLMRDKLRQSLALTAAGVPMPETACIRPAELEKVLTSLPGPPWIVKTLEGHKGRGVMRLDSLASLRSALDLLDGVGQRVLLQRYVEEAAGSDIRVFVLGGIARAAMRRQARGDDFRSNLHRGGTAEVVALDEELSKIAENAARVLGLEIAGVDILISKEGPLVLEVNGSPGLEGISGATGLDLAGEIIEFLVQRAGALV
jgi:ribosomal protein S6--L-glutamate ligase